MSDEIIVWLGAPSQQLAVFTGVAVFVGGAGRARVVTSGDDLDSVAVGVVDEQELLAVLTCPDFSHDLDLGLGLFQGVSSGSDIGNFKRNVLSTVAARAERFWRVD